MSNKRRMRNAAGMTLVEMLVALVILSLGMYANLRMLTESIASLNTAGQQQRAASAIRDLAEIARGIPGETLRGDIRVTGASCTSNVFDPEELFGHVFHSWSTALARTLPGGQGQLQIVERSGIDLLQLSVSWEAPGNEVLRRVAYIPLPAGTDGR